MTAGKVMVRNVKQLLARGASAGRIANDLVAINEMTWGNLVDKKYIWTPEKAKEQIRNCPETVYLSYNNDIAIGSLSAVYMNQSEAEADASWEEKSAYGTLATHNPEGDCAFGLDLSVPKCYQGHRVADRIMTVSFLVGVILANKKGCYLGSRIPRYHRYADKLSVEEYMFGENDGKTKDPEIRLYQSEGFKIIRIIPDYMEDAESLNYGVLMFWENPFYRYTRHFKTLTRIAQFLVAKYVFR